MIPPAVNFTENNIDTDAISDPLKNINETLLAITENGKDLGAIPGISDALIAILEVIETYVEKNASKKTLELNAAKAIEHAIKNINIKIPDETENFVRLERALSSIALLLGKGVDAVNKNTDALRAQTYQLSKPRNVTYNADGQIIEVSMK